MEIAAIIRLLGIVAVILDDEVVKRIFHGIIDLIEEAVHAGKEGD